jgi:ammonium transporter, Amt family
LFACGKYGATGPLAADNSAPLRGLLYGGGATVLLAQLIGSAIVTATTFAVAYVVMYAVNATGLLRVSQEGEVLGIDLHEHGISAYPEYVISGIASPASQVLGGPAAMPQSVPASKRALEPAT